jgi:hypothetical protein
MDANQIRRDDTPKSLFNPLSKDFTTPIRDERNAVQTYTLHSMEIETYPTWLANLIEKDLITAIKNKRNVNPVSEIEHQKIVKEVEANELR